LYNNEEFKLKFKKRKIENEPTNEINKKKKNNDFNFSIKDAVKSVKEKESIETDKPKDAVKAVKEKESIETDKPKESGNIFNFVFNLK
jgi:hypothetical protein